MPAGKRKAEAAPIGLGAPKQGRGGGGRGAGRKPQGVNTKGVDDPGGPKRKQIDLGDVFGGAFSKKNNISDLLGARKGAGAAGADVIEWDYDDGEDDGIILQKQAVERSRADRPCTPCLPEARSHSRRSVGAMSEMMR